MAEKLTAAQYAERINQSVKKTTLGFIETGKECSEADKRLSAEEKKVLHSKLNMDKGTFSNYVAIGNCKALEKFNASLPPARTTLYELTDLAEEEIRRGIDEGVLHPGATRQAVLTWIRLLKGKSAPANDNQIVLRIVRPADFTAEKEDKLTGELMQVLERNGCRLSGTESQTQAAAIKARGEYLRSTTRAHIAAEKLRRQKEQQQLPKAKRSKAWPFTQDQVKVSGDATETDCQQVLDFIGCGDEWQRILDEAERLFGSNAEAESTLAKRPAKKKTA
jgi:hypothetical protein